MVGWGQGSQGNNEIRDSFESCSDWKGGSERALLGIN